MKPTAMDPTVGFSAALTGVTGLFYFQNGWFGRPWDNIYTVTSANWERGGATLLGEAWSLEGQLEYFEVEAYGFRFGFQSYHFSLGDRTVTHDEMGRRALFYTADGFDRRFEDLSKLV